MKISYTLAHDVALGNVILSIDTANNVLKLYEKSVKDNQLDKYK